MADERRASGGVSGRGLEGPEWPGVAGRILTDLGFEIVTGEDERTPTASSLIVALRDKPTLRHFDPEEASYWMTQAGRGRPARLDRTIKALPHEERFAWGRISVADRLGKANQFLAFGGTLRAAALDASTLIVQFSSPAPIQRLAGHSQGTDTLSEPIGAFFGRMMIPIDFDPAAEPRIARAAPLELYCAFVIDAGARLARSPELRRAEPALASRVASEARRLEAQEADAWRGGRSLVDDLRLSEVR